VFELYKKYTASFIRIVGILTLGPMFFLWILDGILIPLLDLVIAPVILWFSKKSIGIVLILGSLFTMKLSFDLIKSAVNKYKQKDIIDFTIYIFWGLIIICLNLFIWFNPNGWLSEGGAFSELFFGDPYIRRIYFWY